MPAPSGQIPPRGPLAGPSQADEDTGRPGSLGEEPHAELSNHLDEGLDHDDRAANTLIMTPSCRRPSWVLRTMLKKPGMPPTMPTRRPADVSVSSSPRP